MALEIRLEKDNPALGEYALDGSIKTRPTVDVLGNSFIRMTSTLRVKGTQHFVVLPSGNAEEIVVTIGTPVKVAVKDETPKG